MCDVLCVCVCMCVCVCVVWACERAREREGERTANDRERERERTTNDSWPIGYTFRDTLHFLTSDSLAGVMCRRSLYALFGLLQTVHSEKKASWKYFKMVIKMPPAYSSQKEIISDVVVFSAICLCTSFNLNAHSIFEHFRGSVGLLLTDTFWENRFCVLHCFWFKSKKIRNRFNSAVIIQWRPNIFAFKCTHNCKLPEEKKKSISCEEHSSAIELRSAKLLIFLCFQWVALTTYWGTNNKQTNKTKQTKKAALRGLHAMFQSTYKKYLVFDDLCWS